MSSSTETRTVVEQIVDSAEERELWITGRLFEHAPYFHAGKGGDTRLAEALRMCLDDKITPQSDGSYQVQGSGGRVYRVAESCSCPASQHAKSRWCKHAVGVAVYVEWQRRLRPPSPVALGTLRAGTLPLPPVTVDERLTQSTTIDLSTAYVTPMPPTMPQEDRMPDDDTQYIPETDDENAPVAIQALGVATPALRPLAPADDDLEQALATWTVQRGIVRTFLAQELKANVDYYTLKIGGKDSKPSLSKAGAEKVLGWLRWSASFAPDTGTWEMLGRPTDVVFYVCTLRTRSGEIVGEGRGARSLKKDGGDVNKAIKMAEKSAMVSSVLRTGAISDCFTQDLEDMQEPAPVQAAAPTKPTSQDLRQRIWAMVQQVAPEATTREAVTRVIMEKTGLALHPDHYKEIIEQLER